MKSLVPQYCFWQYKRVVDNEAKHEESKRYPKGDPCVLLVMATIIGIFVVLFRFPVRKNIKETKEGDKEGNNADSSGWVGKQGSDSKEQLWQKGKKLDDQEPADQTQVQSFPGMIEEHQNNVDGVELDPIPIGKGKYGNVLKAKKESEEFAVKTFKVSHKKSWKDECNIYK